MRPVRRVVSVTTESAATARVTEPSAAIAASLSRTRMLDTPLGAPVEALYRVERHTASLPSRGRGRCASCSVTVCFLKSSKVSSCPGGPQEGRSNEPVPRIITIGNRIV